MCRGGVDEGEVGVCVLLAVMWDGLSLNARHTSYVCVDRVDPCTFS